MRILEITPRFWPATGGAEELLGQISRRLVADGHQVTVLTTNAGSADWLWNPQGTPLSSPPEEWDGIRIRRFPLKHLPAAPYSYALVRRLLWLMNKVKSVPDSWRNIFARYTPWVPGLAAWLASASEEFDLVVAMNIAFESLTLDAARYAKRKGIPLICFPLTHFGEGAIPGGDNLGSFYTMRHQMAVVQQSSALLVMTPTEKAFHQAHGFPENRITVAGSAIDPAALEGGDGMRFRQKHNIEQPFAYALGTLCYDKGTLHTLSAMQKIWSAGYPYELVLAGAVMPEVEKALRHLPIEHRRHLHLLGVISDEEKRDLLAAGDLLVMPSRTESFGTVYLEAWYYSSPVVGAFTWGVQDVICNGRDGCLVPFGDSERLADAILGLLSNPETLHNMGCCGKQRVAAFTWDKRYPIVRDAYQRACELH